MKTNHGKFVAVFVAAMSFAGLGLAATQPTTEPVEPAQPGWHAAMLQKFDTNHDGKLDPAEKRAMHAERKARHQARREELLQRFDKNKDGKLDESERKEMKLALRSERFKTLDANGDGTVSLQEFQAAKFHHPGFGGPVGENQ